MQALNWAALQKLEPLLGTSDCPDRRPIWAEDVALGNCLHKVGIGAQDAFDERGRETTMVFKRKYHLGLQRPKKDWWYFKNTHQTNWGTDCCSSEPFAFHGYKKPHQLRQLENEFYRNPQDVR